MSFARAGVHARTKTTARVLAGVRPGVRLGVHRRAHSRGLALIAVLWMVAALTLLVTSLLAVSRASTQSAQNHGALVQATAVGDAAIQLALVEWQHSKPNPVQRVHGHYRFEGLPIEVALTPASAYINLNRASPRLLHDLLHYAGGLDSMSAETLAQRIIDWRDPDEATLDGSSELAPYLAAGLAVRPRNSAFLSAEDLLQVAGIGLDLFARIEPLITVWGGGSGVDPRSAPENVLAVLAKGDQGLVAMLVRQRAQGSATIDTSMLDRANLGGANANILHLQATVTMVDGSRIVRGRWLEPKAGDDGAPWQSIATEAARYLAAPSN